MALDSLLSPGTLFLAASLALLAVALYAAYSALHVVDDGEVVALYVRDDLRAVVGPGLHLFPPLVSTTHPVDVESMVVRRPDGEERVPEGYGEGVREVVAGERRRVILE